LARLPPLKRKNKMTRYKEIEEAIKITEKMISSIECDRNFDGPATIKQILENQIIIIKLLYYSKNQSTTTIEMEA